MGASNSRHEEDRSLELCYDRIKFVKKAIGCRCAMAEAHFIYIQSLKDTGRTLLEVFDAQLVPIQSDLHDSTEANEEPLMPNKTTSNEGSPRKTEDIVAPPVEESVTVPNNKHEDSVSAPSPWDYFDLSHPGDDQISSQKINGCNLGRPRGGDTRTSLNVKDERYIHDSNLKGFEINEEEDEINIVLERKFSIKSNTDYENFKSEPLSEGVVESFGNLNLTSDILDAVSSPSIASVSSEISEIFPIERSQSPDLSPLREIASSVSEVVNLTKLIDMEEADIPENSVEHKVSLQALYLSIKNIDRLFLEASECGQEVLCMLEANKVHFDHPVQKQKGESKRSLCLITCFCHQDEANQVSRELGHTSKRYLMSQRRNMSTRSFSSVANASQNPGDDSLANSSNDIYCMRSGSHVSSLERLYAWEKKLYDEVKASTIVRRQYDQKCKLLGNQESKAESAKTVDKTRATIKDLHSRIRVSIKTMETISSRIIRIRDSELQPQFEELIKGLGNMWQRMHECHKRQFEIISATLISTFPTETTIINSDDSQWIKYHLEQLLSLTSSNYTRLIFSYQSYLKEIEGWLVKCFLFPKKSSNKKRSSKHDQHTVPISEYYPPILITCRSWIQGLEKLAAEASNLSLGEDKHDGEKTKNVVDKGGGGHNNFCASLAQIISQLMNVSESSTKMYTECIYSGMRPAETIYIYEQPEPS